MHRIRIRRGDITAVSTDVIVNAADERLVPGGGVCGAIHRAAGPELEEACRSVGRCPTGSARITRAYRLPARYVVHAVGPRWSGGGAGEAELLASAHVDAVHLAADHGGRTIAFPAISCGIFGYPAERAALVAIRAVRRALADAPGIERVTFFLLDPDVEAAFRRVREDEAVRVAAGAA